MNDISEFGILISTYIFLFGLCIGSFLNVVILRGLSGEDMVFSRSKCPKCNNQLKWYMNIPLLSFVFLRGKCAFCGEKISFQYPLVELITALGFLINYLTFGLCWKMVFMCIFLSLFVIIAATDFLETVVLDIHCYLLLIAGLLYSCIKLNDINIIQSILGAVFGFLIFEIMARIGKKLVNIRMFGEGDSLIALGLGSIFGFKKMIILICLSIALQGIFSIPILAYKAFKNNKKLLALSYEFVFLSIIYLFFVYMFNLFEKEALYLTLSLVMSLFLIWSLINIIKDIQEKMLDKNENPDDEIQGQKYFLLPFGPALIFSALICIFYIDNIKEILLNYFF